MCKDSEETEVKKLKSVITEFSQESQVVNSWEGSFTGGYLSSIGFAEVEISSESPLDRGEYLGKEVTIIVGDDEPEVLSQEFIDKYKVDYDNWMPAVPIVHLQNILMPKQEEITEMNVNDLAYFITQVENEGLVVIEKPEIPQFVADYIEKQKEFGYSFLLAYEVISDSNKRNEADKKLVDYIQKNQDDFVRAWYGYEIEQEPKYYVINNENELLLSKNNKNEVISYLQDYQQAKNILSNLDHYQLTEQEIKDYDKNYWAFAEPVEQVEHRLLF